MTLQRLLVPSLQSQYLLLVIVVLKSTTTGFPGDESIGNTHRFLKENYADDTHRFPEEKYDDDTHRFPEEKYDDNTHRFPKQNYVEDTYRFPEENYADDTHKFPEEKYDDNTHRFPKENYVEGNTHRFPRKSTTYTFPDDEIPRGTHVIPEEMIGKGSHRFRRESRVSRRAEDGSSLDAALRFPENKTPKGTSRFLEDETIVNTQTFPLEDTTFRFPEEKYSEGTNRFSEDDTAVDALRFPEEEEEEEEEETPEGASIYPEHKISNSTFIYPREGTPRSRFLEDENFDSSSSSPEDDTAKGTSRFLQDEPILDTHVIFPDKWTDRFPDENISETPKRFPLSRTPYDSSRFSEDETTLDIHRFSEDHTTEGMSHFPEDLNSGATAGYQDNAACINPQRQDQWDPIPPDFTIGYTCLHTIINELCNGTFPHVHAGEIGPNKEFNRGIPSCTGSFCSIECIYFSFCGRSIGPDPPEESIDQREEGYLPLAHNDLPRCNTPRYRGRINITSIRNSSNDRCWTKLQCMCGRCCESSAKYQVINRMLDQTYRELQAQQPTWKKKTRTPYTGGHGVTMTPRFPIYEQRGPSPIGSHN